MSRLAVMAREHWKKHRPTAYAELDNPESFFANLAEAAQEQIDTLADALAGPDDPAETFMEKVSRLTQARHAAEGHVLREMVLLAEESPKPESSDPSSDADFEDAVAEFQRLREQLLTGNFDSE